MRHRHSMKRFYMDRDIAPEPEERNPAWLYDETDVEPDDFQQQYENWVEEQEYIKDNLEDR